MYGYELVTNFQDLLPTNTLHEWIIDDKHSGIYSRKVFVVDDLESL